MAKETTRGFQQVDKPHQGEEEHQGGKMDDAPTPTGFVAEHQ